MCRCVGGIASGSSKLAPNATCAPLTNPNCEASKILTRPGNLSAFAMICASSLGCTPVVVSVTLGSCTFPTSLFSESMCSHLIRDLLDVGELIGGGYPMITSRSGHRSPCPYVVHSEKVRVAFLGHRGSAKLRSSRSFPFEVPSVWLPIALDSRNLREVLFCFPQGPSYLEGSSMCARTCPRRSRSVPAGRTRNRPRSRPQGRWGPRSNHGPVCQTLYTLISHVPRRTGL